ncbi:NAD(P)(+) transhydrogenase (Re/Si-specific) subunit beta [Cellulomonas fimi]|uniref:NAD(P) transhydrogenase subunit beta n=1 Tax=Cellulomonas fimi TaxID=1708 RepID=A0A7Y0QHM2_CELFI|nr:NAD(P)(+) transhydrogenase (Re/Si-specific) subunit beta [Cellulomonas fimi]NMR21331.1 NAD(P)(+) transhydrogenase (Re/Si-specific) subunit beta [Cellulomonas fimi]
MTAVEVTVRLVYLAAAVCFVLGLHLMRSPATARRGNLLSAAGMLAAIVATVVLLAAGSGGDEAVRPLTVSPWGWIALWSGLAVGSVAGLVSARRVEMTAMPQLVSLFNAVGGGAAALVAIVDFLRVSGEGVVTAGFSVPVVLDVIIGSVTFSGSLVAAGKLQGWVSGAPIAFRGSRALSIVSAVVAVGGGTWLVVTPSGWLLVAVVVAALAFGVLMVLPIGGADMPVVISLLNAFTGLAVAMAGFVVENQIMIIAGALVGASGTILTKLMADAMNRSVVAIMVGGFGTGDGGGDAGAAVGGTEVRRVEADDVAIQLAYADKVIIVPGYGLAAAQAQRECGELGSVLSERGITVLYAIHPVAGRMPGHMNVLLAEADVPYTQLVEMDDVNPEFATCDVALVVGANDVTNPAARRPGNAISGMPILDVDKARSVVVIKRSLGHGYAGLDNELYGQPQTGMLFADAKKGLAQILAAVKTHVG